MTAVPAPANESRLGLPLVGSLLLHGAIVGVVLLLRGSPPPPLPPTYRVNLVAAPPGERAIGVVRPPDAKPAPTPPAATPAPSRPVTDPTGMAAPPNKSAAKTPPKSTATAPTTAKPAKPAKASDAPRAGGGPVGGTGSDVASVRTEGIEFPYPGYLENVVRQIALRFKPPRGSTLHAEVVFVIHRDGSVSNVRFLQSSGKYDFDIEARGAVESAAEARAFGPLPRGFPDDALPVIFSFDPRLIR